MLYFELQSRNIAEAYNCTTCTGIIRVSFVETKIKVVFSVTLLYYFTMCYAGHVLYVP